MPDKKLPRQGFCSNNLTQLLPVIVALQKLLPVELRDGSGGFLHSTLS